MTRELDHLVGRELENFLQPATDVHKDLLALLGRATLASGDIAIAAASDVPASRASPDTNSVEALAHINNHAHDFAVLLILKGLADGSEHRVQPELVNVDGALVFELIRPLATMFVLRIFPFGTHILLEEVVIRLYRQFRDRSDVVLALDVSTETCKKDSSS